MNRDKETTVTIIDTRLNKLADITLLSGGHASFEDGACALEAVSWLAGEVYSDHPDCVCPVIGAFVRSWNDSLPTGEDRDRLLKPLLPKLIGTTSTPDVQDQRVFMAADWAVRTFTVAWLRQAGLTVEAAELEALPELSTVELCGAAMPAIDRARERADAAGYAAGYAARAAAGDAARAAAGAAAGDAAGAAAGAAVGAAVGYAAGAAARAAAGYAAGAAAGAAAGDAARAAARAAAGDALAETVAELQASAVLLIERMCEVVR